MFTCKIGQSRPIFEFPTFLPNQIDTQVAELAVLNSNGDYDGIIERAPQILESIRVCRRGADRMEEDDDVEDPYTRAEFKTYCALVEAFLKTGRFQDAKEIAEGAITVHDGLPLFADQEAEYFYDITKARLSNLLVTACFSLAAGGPVAERDENIEIGLEEGEVAFNIICKYIDNQPDEILDDNLRSSIYLNQVRNGVFVALELEEELAQLIADEATEDKIARNRESLLDLLDHALALASIALEEYQPSDRTLTRALQNHKREIREVKERYFPPFDTP